MNGSSIKLGSRPCAICGVYNHADTVFAARLGEENLDERTFSARRFYDKKIHFQWVRCRNCGLLRSDPMANPELIADFYTRSHFTYDDEEDNLRRTYGRYLKQASACLRKKERLLEIGCGNGFFLEEALAQGFTEVVGVEPSEEAAAKANPNIKQNIRIGFFKKTDYPANYFDLICIFQTLDHLFDPASILKDCYELLRPGGAVFAINHNARSWSANLLGESSPIFDIEHTYLYDFSTMRKIFEKSGYRTADLFPVKNRFSLNYVFSLVPLRPAWLKRALNNGLKITGISKIPLWVSLGNLGIIAQKHDQ